MSQMRRLKLFYIIGDSRMKEEMWK